MAPTFLTAAHDFAHYAGYPLAILGTLTNILCVIVLVRPKMKGMNVWIYFLAMSVNDIFVLNICLVDKWMHHSYDIEPRRINLFLCKLLPFLDKFFLQMGSWIVVALSAEQMFAIYKPIRYRNFGQWHRPLVLMILILLIAAVNSPILYFYELDATCHTSAPKAYISPKYLVFYNLYWSLPLLFLLIFTMAIVYKLQKKTPFDTALASPMTLKRKQSNKENISLLIFINCMFIVCTSPLAICGIWINVINWEKTSVSTQQRLFAASVISHVFAYLNNATNIIPYVLMSSSFCEELKVLLKIKNTP